MIWSRNWFLASKSSFGGRGRLSEDCVSPKESNEPNEDIVPLPLAAEEEFDELGWDCCWEARIGPCWDCCWEARIGPRWDCCWEARIDPCWDCCWEARIGPCWDCCWEARIGPCWDCCWEARGTDDAREAEVIDATEDDIILRSEQDQDS